MASPEEMASYYADYPDPSDPKFAEQVAEHEKRYGKPPIPAPVVPPVSPGGGKPAARQTDTTAHGGLITKGEPTVMIGYLPAARVSDMHNCPMVNGVVPHVGGPVIPPGAPTVMIGYMPAARMGDQATCTGPPDAIARGEFTVMIG